MTNETGDASDALLDRIYEAIDADSRLDDMEVLLTLTSIIVQEIADIPLSATTCACPEALLRDSLGTALHDAERGWDAKYVTSENQTRHQPQSNAERAYGPGGGSTRGSTPSTPLGPCGVLGPPQAGIGVVGGEPTGEAQFSSALPSLRRYGFWWVGTASSGDGATSSWPNDGRKRLDGGPTGEWSNSHRPSASLLGSRPCRKLEVRRSVAGFTAYPCQGWAPLGGDKGTE
jgi:hypothetical protein